MDERQPATAGSSPSNSSHRHHAAWGAMFAGAALSVYGWTRKSMSGAALGVAGGAIALKAASAGPIADMIGTERSCCCSMLIMHNAAELYAFWKDTSKALLWMGHIASVVRTDDTHIRWTRSHQEADALEWITEVTQDLPNSRIAWKATKGAEGNHEISGEVEFHPMPHDRGTRVSVTLRYKLRAGLLHAAAPTVIGENPQEEMRENLRRFKMLIEAGEIATTEGQSHGPRKTKPKLLETILREEPKPRAASA